MHTQRDFINEICTEENITIESLSQGYVLRLTKGSTRRTIYGPYWAINSAASDRIACDKCGCYALLNESGVPAIPHFLLSHPVKRYGWTGDSGIWSQAIKLLNTHKTVVVKPNQGSNGNGVQLCENINQLEAAVHSLFAAGADVAVSPFYKIKNEYRVFFLNGECHFAYGKTKNPDDWRHNLSQGATAFELTEQALCHCEDRKAERSNPENLRPLDCFAPLAMTGRYNFLNQLKNLASQAATAIDINFATVDVAEFENGEIAIMEINAGVQAKQLLEQLPHLRPIIKDIYAGAIRAMF